MSTNRTTSGGATSSTQSSVLYGGVVLSDTTKQKRAQIKQLQDEFMTFAWGDCNAFDVFGAFILNDKKGSLKFFNGPNFSNEYSKPQFDPSGGELLGVTFQKQSISFTIGVYWISAEDYRKFLNWLSPNKTDYLYFGYDAHYRYNVKLSKIADSTKWIVGSEYIDGVKIPMYYTEIPLSFEIQGEPCAKGFNSYEFGEAEGFMWKQEGDVMQETITVKSSQCYILKGNQNKDTWVELNGENIGVTYKSNWVLQCNDSGKLLIQKELGNKNSISCMEDDMELFKWNTSSSSRYVVENRKSLSSKDYSYLTEENIIKEVSDLKTGSDMCIKKCYIVRPVYIYTYGTVQHNKKLIPRWYLEGNSANYLGRDSEPQTAYTCTYIDASSANPKNIYFQLPKSYFNQFGFLKDPGNSVVWMVQNSGGNTKYAAGHFPGWDIVQQGDPSNPHTTYYIQIQSTNKPEPKLLTHGVALTKRYPVSAGSVYKIIGQHTELCPHYFILNNNGNILSVPEKTGHITTETISIEEDGYILLQCIKDDGEYERDLQLSLVPNSKWTASTNNTDTKKSFEAKLLTSYDFIPSDLDTPFELTMPFIFCQTDGAEKPVYKVEGEIVRGQEQITLFSVELHNLTHTIGYRDDLTKQNLVDLGANVTGWNDDDTLAGSLSETMKNNIKTEIIKLAPKITLTYNSMTGLLYLKFADSQDQILNLLTLNDTGDRIVKSCSTFKVKMPGRFSNTDFYDQDILVRVHIEKTNDSAGEVKIANEFTYHFSNNKPEIVCFPRTNTI